MPLYSLISSLQSHADHISEDRIACERTISWIREHEEFAFARTNLDGHLTGSILITNPERTRVLLMLHKKFERWQQFGGHCEGETDVVSVAMREFHEESGIEIEPEIVGDIFLVGVHDILMDQKGTPPHQHYDIIYLGVIPEDTEFSRQEAEVDDIRWFDIDGIEDHVDDDMAWRIQRIRNI